MDSKFLKSKNFSFRIREDLQERSSEVLELKGDNKTDVLTGCFRFYTEKFESVVKPNKPFVKRAAPMKYCDGIAAGEIPQVGPICIVTAMLKDNVRKKREDGNMEIQRFGFAFGSFAEADEKQGYNVPRVDFAEIYVENGQLRLRGIEWYNEEAHARKRFDDALNDVDQFMNTFHLL